jgi:ligand-binding sensor domain-containing protein/signal transduction histidine kinase
LNFYSSIVRRLRWALGLGIAAACLAGASAPAKILWSDLGTTLARETGPGHDILIGAVNRDATASDTLYFKFHVLPHSDVSTEEYFAAFELFDADTEHLAVGNSLKAWGYSAYNTEATGEGNTVKGDIDLHSGRPESGSPGFPLTYELPRHGIENTIVFKVEFIPGEPALVTVWLNPNLAPGATEAAQPQSLTTQFRANATFTEIRLRHGGPGGGWTFSDMAIATAFSDFVAGAGAEIAGPGSAKGGGAIPWTFRHWQREQGLPQNSVRALLQTKDGYIWVGTDDGIARFDGVHFKSFDRRTNWAGGAVNVLLEDRSGGLWIGTAGEGLARLQGDAFRAFTRKDGLPADTITALAQDNTGRLWVGTEAGLVVLQDNKLGPIPASESLRGKAITCLFKDRGGTIWLGATGAGVFRFADGQFLPVTEPSLESLLLDPHCLLADADGRVWIGAGDDFVLCREGDQWRRYRLPRHLARPYITSLVEEPDGTVWAGSVSEGLFQFQAGKLAAINASSGLADNFVQSLLVDREGNLWAGTVAGLDRLRRSDLSVIGQREGLDSGAARGLAEISPGVIWAGKPSGGIYRWDGKHLSPLSVPILLQTPLEVNALLTARDGSCWLASTRGMWRFPNPKANEDVEQSGLAEMNVLALARDRENGLWAGTKTGELWHWQTGAWLAETNFPRTRSITALEVDSDGSAWVGTDGSGLFRYRDSVVTHLDKSSGLLSDLVRALHLDNRGVLWIGTAGGGLSRWREGQLANFSTREGLPDNTINQILEDDSERLWLGSNRGLASVRKRDLEKPASSGNIEVFPRVYGLADGMPSEECTGGFCPAGLRSSTGLLWFSTLRGLVAADPRPPRGEPPVPQVILEEVLVDGLVPAPDTNNPSVIRIKPGKHRIEIHYTAPNFTAAEQVRFQYRLDGVDPDWIAAGAERKAPYSPVRPGEYQFRVAACNRDGAWSESGAGLSLIVLPSFWQSGWVIGAGVVGLLVSVSGLARLLEKRKHQHRLKQLEQERALERERARIAQDLHDDLGSSLTRISLLSDLARADRDHPTQVESHAQKISQSAAQTVQALEEIVWALRPGSDSLQSLVEYIAHFANELFEGDRARCRLDLPPDLPARALPPEMRHNIFLVVKEALTNALKHAGAHEVRVQAKVEADALEILVQDDGRGFNAQTPPGQGSYHGLGNMRRRAEAMRGTLAMQSSPGKGTMIRLSVSLPNGAAPRDRG